MTRLKPARPDGRPLYFDLPDAAFRVPCHFCATRLGIGAAYARGDAFFNDPANSPVAGTDGLSDEAVYYVCKSHLPANVVIFDPTTNMCHDKHGTNVWSEEFFMPGPGESS